MHLRIDSTNAILYKYDGISEQMVDSLSMEVTSLDSAEGCKHICISDSTDMILDGERRVKTFVSTCILASGSQITKQKYAWGIGEIYSETSDIGIEASRIVRTLNYAKINGVEYGNFIPQNITPDVAFYPLHVGDVWQYRVYYPYRDDDSSYCSTIEVRGLDTLDNGKVYFTLTNSEDYCLRYLRIDSTDATVWEYFDGVECMIDSLSLEISEFGFQNDCYGFVHCIDNMNEVIFDEERLVRVFHHYPSTTCQYRIDTEYHYTPGIGKVFSHMEYPTPSGTTFAVENKLLYAKINGVEYGNFIPQNINPDVAFYPLHVGDTWQYTVELKYRDSSKDSSYYASVYVYGIDTLSDGKEYYIIANSEFDCMKHIRIDSIDATVWNESTMLDSLSMQPNDMMSGANSQNPKMCFADSTEILFDTDVRVKTFAPINILTSQNAVADMGVKYLYKYAWGIGEIYSETSDIGIEASRIIRTLNYAKINAVEYGTFVSIQNSSAEVPTEYSLAQNYPNPFNPSTTIKYSIPVETVRATSEQIVTLKVYDTLGREVATLVNKAQKAGNYEVNFNASVLTSGVYFYTLTAGKYRATNKMLLVK